MTPIAARSKAPSTLLNQISEDVFFTKDDLKDPRLGDFVSNLVQAHNGEFAVKLASEKSPDIAILGYPDDEGIRMNGGRLGAALAPLEIRKYFYKMTPALTYPDIFQILDLGDVDTKASLDARHETGQFVTEGLSSLKTKWISLGGGHDYGYADGSGFLRSTLKQNLKPIIINFDAHLDVRPNDKGNNSGTPFYRLLNDFSGSFDFYELGLQPQCNSRYHFQWAEQKGATLWTMADIEKDFVSTLQKKLKADQHRPLFISLDMDVITSSEAPGCSQSWVTGCPSKFVFDAISWLCKSFDVYGLGIYETSPALDIANQTSKLAALFAHHFFFTQLELSRDFHR